MAPITAAVEITRSPEDVFAYIADVERHPEWQQGLVSVINQSGGPLHVGSRLVHRRKLGLATVATTSEVTVFDSPRVIGFRGLDGPIRAEGAQRVEPADGGSRVLFEMEMTGHGLGVLMLPLARRQASRQVAESHERLKQILETAAG
jgi:uncharacterized membrane protein